MLRAVALALVALLSCQAPAQDASARIYVRRIEFIGVSRASDLVLRRELMQVEGAYLNTVALHRSIQRLEALPYVDSAVPRLRAVPGTVDVVDVVIEIDEAPARHYGVGGGYSEAFRASLHGYISNDNVFGTGQQVAFSAEDDEVRSSTQLSHVQPYATPEGVRRTIALSSRQIDRLTVDASALEADFTAVLLEYGYPLVSSADVASFESLRGSPCAPPIRGLDARALGLANCSRESTFRFGIEWRSADLTAGSASSAQLVDWIATNGDVRMSGDGVLATEVDELDLFLGWGRDTRDRPVFAEQGVEQTLTLRAAFPGSDVEYYALDYEIVWHQPLGQRWTLRLRGRLGYGAAYGSDTSSLPPYLDWFAGGPRTVRGYRENALGPRDSLGNPYGGDALVAGQLEIMTAWPNRWEERIRAGFFYDAGNVFYDEDGVAFRDEAGQPLDYGFDWPELRHSVGLALEVLIPFGLLRASYAVPLDAQEHSSSLFRRDEVERFQISFGVGF